MKKKMLVMSGMVGLALFGCGNNSNENYEANASIREGYEVISETSVGAYTTVYEMKNIETKCYITLAETKTNYPNVGVSIVNQERCGD